MASETDDRRREIEWKQMQDAVEAEAHDDIPDVLCYRRAVRWVLTETFGDSRRYLFDAEFHAKVHTAEQLLNRLRDLSRPPDLQ